MKDVVAVLLYMNPTGPKPAPKGAKNVLFVVSDDYRPSTNKYGVTASVTPNLDKLAETGILFRHAYIQFSYCAPSRNSFMSGRRPDATKVRFSQWFSHTV